MFATPFGGHAGSCFELSYPAIEIIDANNDMIDVNGGLFLHGEQTEDAGQCSREYD